MLYHDRYGRDLCIGDSVIYEWPTGGCGVIVDARTAEDGVPEVRVDYGGTKIEWCSCEDLTYVEWCDDCDDGHPPGDPCPLRSGELAPEPAPEEDDT